MRSILAIVSYEGGDEQRKRETFYQNKWHELSIFSPKDLSVSRLEVIIALEGDQGQGQGKQEHQEGGDDEAEDAGKLNVKCWVRKWARSQIDAAHTEFWRP